MKWVALVAYMFSVATTAHFYETGRAGSAIVCAFTALLQLVIIAAQINSERRR